MIRTIAWVITGMTIMWALAHWHIPVARTLTKHPPTGTSTPRYRHWRTGVECAYCHDNRPTWGICCDPLANDLTDEDVP